MDSLLIKTLLLTIQYTLNKMLPQTLENVDQIQK